MLPSAPGPRVIDVSFISLAKVLGAVLGCLAPRYDVLAMVKPQFEVGRGRVGKGGVVRDAGDRRAALVGGRARPRWGSGRACSASTPRGWPGRRATARRFVWLAEPAARASATASGRSCEALRARSSRESGATTVFTHRRRRTRAPALGR